MKDICIDNGGTLTDICVFEGASIWTTKTLTTPFDLTQCLFDGLRKVSAGIYGEENVERLLAETASIKYSTTQGTNALVERRGPRLGLVIASGFDLNALKHDPRHAELLEALVGDRIVAIDLGVDSAALKAEIIRGTNALAELGTSRIVVCFCGPDYAARERAFVSLYEQSFRPQHLGTVPVAIAHETSGDANEVRRMWSAILNAFLHPPMESFLFNAQKRLRNYRGGATFRIFRNDGGAARVAKTAAVKTYSSGPRGGMEAVRALAVRLGYDHVLSVDVGGTTSDLGYVERDNIRSDMRGRIEGVESSFELCDIVSIGVGGGSVIRAAGGRIAVGPESVGAVPGPACFGLGGSSATVTDVFFALGIIDPKAFFDGSRPLDKGRAEAAIASNVAEPLGLSVPAAAYAMREAWVNALAAGIRSYANSLHDTVLLAFGGAGPMAICEVAAQLGLRQVLVPRLAALFSALGVSFAPITQEYEVTVTSDERKDLRSLADRLLRRAERDMEAEGVSLSDCHLHTRIVAAGEPQDVDIHHPKTWPDAVDALQLRVTASRHQTAPAFPPSAASGRSAPNAGERSLRRADGTEHAIPVYPLPDCTVGDHGAGPAVLEGHFFTAYLPERWTFRVIESGDFLLESKA